MMNAYVVFKKGVYIQEILAVVPSLDDAIRSAYLYSTKEPDDYHDIVVASARAAGNVDSRVLISLPKSGWERYVGKSNAMKARG